VAASFAVLGHLHWLWIPAAVLLESASMAAFAIMLRRLLAAGGASVGIRPMLATAYAANAVSVSVPLAGPSSAPCSASSSTPSRRSRRRSCCSPTLGVLHHLRFDGSSAVLIQELAQRTTMVRVLASVATSRSPARGAALQGGHGW
jgi:hypothetical protein